jgi:hypothetical protein
MDLVEVRGILSEVLHQAEVFNRAGKRYSWIGNAEKHHLLLRLNGNKREKEDQRRSGRKKGIFARRCHRVTTIILAYSPLFSTPICEKKAPNCVAGIIFLDQSMNSFKQILPPGKSEDGSKCGTDTFYSGQFLRALRTR